ncbi:MAG: nucleotidyltransferase domain-containing protein [Clostridiales bacterium]|nr:nucleotidyltransferase domain-containing protein [Clostridiales bacterium]MCD7954828.1 nucleotidyltransferase domain-containing protein [Lachnospiraceae bacterium]
MSSEVYTVSQIKNILTPVFRRHNVRRAVLFGSYGKGRANEKSDLDILVDSGLKGLKFVGLIEEVREAVDKDIDMIDVSHLEKNSEIDSEIQETGVVIYEE